MSPRSPHYIPVGCIGVARSEIEVEDSIWAANGNEWQYVQNPKSTMPTAVPEDVARHTMVDSRLRVALLKAPPLKAVESLFYGDWVQLQFRVFPSVEALGTFRIYILPDNAIRRLELRAQPGLTKHRAAVLGQVDCAPGAWLGTEAPVAFARNPFTQIISKKTETSLLELFNDIPSPAPDTSVVTDPFFKKAMSDILQSDIAGLKTELKPYQRRSAAMMMQKEIQPGQMLDPRFLHLQDQQRSSWYFDPIARTVSRDTGQYDGVSGGILAEEMGTGKTIICLALLLATRVFPSEAPGFYWSREPPMRKSIGSLMDMAASCATRHSQPWRSYFGYTKKEEYDGNPFVKALQRNPGVYYLPGPEPKRCGRTGRNFVSKPTKVYLSSTSLVIVPNNLLSQWRQEIKKHTEGLEVMVLAANDRVPDVETIVEHDVLLISQTRFEKLVKHDNIAQSPLASIHFKRCIIDEGHVLGNSRINHKSLLLLGLDSLQFTSRWIVTGTPSRGLFGARNRNPESANSSESGTHTHSNSNASVNQSSNWLERNDLEKLGSIAALYLKARPWANSARETEDTLAKWTAYLVPPRLGPGRVGRWDCLKSTVDSLIVRHRMEEVIDQLPPVDEKIVLLEGSYQDMLAMNLFAMMIIFNSVQSQRTDQDYFFHMKQRPSLLEIVHNLKQSSFFGGSFFTAQEIEKSVQTAEKFLEEQKVKISAEDDELLRTAIEFGRLALTSRLRSLSNQFHEMPICVAGFPGGAGKAWSLDGEMNGPICTSTPMVVALQKLLYHASGRPEELNSLLNGGLVQEGLLQREKVITEAHSTNITRTKEEKSKTLAGNTKLGDDSHSPKKARSRVRGTEVAAAINDSALAAAMAETKLVATVSAKLSYLIDSIVKYQDKEKMIIFYENPNVAWYLAGILEMVSYPRAARTTRTNDISCKYSISFMPKVLLWREETNTWTHFTTTKTLGELHSHSKWIHEVNCHTEFC